MSPFNGRWVTVASKQNKNNSPGINCTREGEERRGITKAKMGILQCKNRETVKRRNFCQLSIFKTNQSPSMQRVEGLLKTLPTNRQHPNIGKKIIK